MTSYPAGEQIRMAVIGAGWVACARHLPALKRTGRCRILGVIDRREERARALAEKFKLRYHGVLLDAPWLDHVDAVTVAVAPMAHYAVAHEMLSRGKHVLVEKPLTTSVSEGEELAAVAEEKSLVLGIVHNFQFARAARLARAALNEGKWGRVIGVHALQLSNRRRRLPEWCGELPGGLFYDESPHLLYLLREFGGSLRLRHARMIGLGDDGATPSLVRAEFECEAGPASLSMHFDAPVSEWCLMVFTESGLAIIDLFRDILHYVPNDACHGAVNVVRSSGSLIGDHLRGFWASGLRMLTGNLDYGNKEVARRFLDAVLTGANPEGINARAALDVLRMQHEILRCTDTASAVQAMPSGPESIRR